MEAYIHGPVNYGYRYSERREWIDVLRGIAMVAVVLQHANNPGNPALTRVLLSFHMPLFFFISGMLMSGRDFKKMPFADYLKGLAFKIGIPLVTYMMIQDGTEIILSGIIPDVGTLLRPLLNWFLITLFFMKLICYVKYRFVSARKVIVVIVVEAIAFLVCGYTEIKFVQTTLCALVFGDIGYILCPYIEKMYIGYQKKRQFRHVGGGFCFLITLTIILCAYNDPVMMYVNEYGNKLVFIIISIIGILACVDLAFAFEKNEFLSYLGRNTIIIYITHFAIYRILREKIWLNFFNTVSSQGNFPNYWMLFGITMIMELPIIYMANKFFPILFGRSKKKNV